MTAKKTTTTKKTTRKNKSGAGRPSFVTDFLADKEKCNHLENYAMFRSSKKQLAEIFGTSIDTILRLIKKYTLETYNVEMTYEQFVKFKFEQKGSTYLNFLLQKATEGRSDKLMIYVAENIFRFNEKFEPEKETEEDKTKVVYIPVMPDNLSIEQINSMTKNSQSELQEKINEKMKLEKEKKDSDD